MLNRQTAKRRRDLETLGDMYLMQLSKVTSYEWVKLMERLSDHDKQVEIKLNYTYITFLYEW